MARTDRPKRYMSAFLIFLNEFRKKNKSKGISNMEKTQKGAAVWRKLATKDKQPYVRSSLKLKKKYDVAIEKYKEVRISLPKKEKSEQNTEKTNAKDPNRPKMPLSSYMLFMQDFRKQNSRKGYDMIDMVSKGAQVWQTLSKKQLTPYQEEAMKKSEEYQKKLQTYKRKTKKAAAKNKTETKTKTKLPCRASKKSRKSSKLSSPSRTAQSSCSAGRRDNSKRRR